MAKFGLAGLRLFGMACVLAFATPAFSYSLLTHEQLVDVTWDDSIVPFLLSRYPGLTPAQLDEARSYAYGGCVIQDIGYYPFGQVQLSDLMHYVRSGDFVVALLRNAHTPLARAIEFARRLRPSQLRDVLHTSRLPERIKEYLRNSRRAETGGSGSAVSDQ